MSSQNSTKHSNIPKWLTIEYFQTILHNYEPEMKNIKHFELEEAIPPGQNFTSIIWRVKTILEMKDDSTKSQSYIVKTELPFEKGGEFVSKMNMFTKEMIMYRKYLPAFESLYKNIGWHIQFGPKCLLHLNENNLHPIFVDMNPKGFRNPDRFTGCNLEEMNCILKKLAEFHAASAVYFETYGEFSKEFQSGFVNLENGYEFHKRIYDSRSDNFKKCMATWDFENIDEYIQKFPTFEQYWKCCRSTLGQRNSFCVLNHGDFWSGNVMLSYDEEGSVKDLLLVDYQTCNWGSPAEDLLFFLTLSPMTDIRIKQYDKFVAVYHARLIECLKALNYPKSLPKLRDLHKEMLDQRNTFYAFFAIFNHMGVILLQSNTDMNSNLENLVRKDATGEDFHTVTLTNPLLIQSMKQLFPFYHNRGLFNFNDYDECEQ